MELSLSGLSWEVKGFWPYVPIKEKSMETGQTLAGITDWIPAAVPGGIHVDLFKDGQIENPYFGKNSLHCEWVENRWWMYRTTFSAIMDGHDLRGRRVYLLFMGLDYEAEVFVNGVSCGSHKGMYDRFEVDITELLREENKLVVIFKSVPDEMGQIGYTSRTSTQKSRFNYKWDFSTRLVNIGFWKEVLLYVEEDAEVKNLHLDTNADDETGKIFLSGSVWDDREDRSRQLYVKVSVTGTYDRRSQDVKALVQSADPMVSPEVTVTETEFDVKDGRFLGEVDVPEPYIWHSNGSGIPWLYQVEVKLTDRNKVFWTRQYQTGIRSLKLADNEDSPEGALGYTFVLNGRKIYIKGVNMTPLDHVYGAVTKERYALMVTAMVQANANLVRIWGGGLIEKEDFYDLCDENGILIWQEFIQSSSGIDNKPAEDSDYLALLAKAAIAAVREKRNHVALAVYSGGNELMEAPDRPSGYENKNLALLKRIVDREDGRRNFLPTSASGPREFVTREKGVSHDIHGNWRFEGNPGHYELYGESDSLFHSEFGMDGVSEAKSLQRFLPEKNLYPTPMSGNDFWQHHGEWWGTYFRDCDMFGLIPRKTEYLETFIRCSQYMQAEGLRFILEADRRRAFRNSGTIIWQLNEPWPNSSCTNLVDYYGETKAAYYQTRRAYERRHISMDYRSLTYQAGKKAVFPVYVSNDEDTFTGSISMTLRNLCGRILEEKSLEAGIESNRSTKVTEFALTVPKEPVFFICLLLRDEEGRKLSDNRYLFSTKEQEPFGAFLSQKTKVKLESGKPELAAGGRMHIAVKLTNTGNRAALGVRVIAKQKGWLLWSNENDEILFPGEIREQSCYLIPEPELPFEEIREQEEPVLQAEYL